MFKTSLHTKILLLITFCAFSYQETTRAEVDEITATIRNWADEFSKELQLLTQLTHKDKVKESFESANVVEEKWDIIVENVANNIREMMQEKVDAVKAIKNHAEYLSIHRKIPINMHSSYDYYDANNLTKTKNVPDRSVENHETEKMWECAIPPDPKKLCFSKEREDQQHIYRSEYDSNNYNRRVRQKIYDNPNRATCNNIAFLKRPKKYYRSMNLAYNPHFDAEINLNHSIIRVTPGVHARNTTVINGIRWSEGLDLTFKCNFERDPTLKWQYFGSPDGFMRFYPAMKWSDEEYDQSFDFRIRSWYVESISSAKDIIILVDRSGSMKGIRREIAIQIVNSILDTLTDNDYVNIYTFTNSTESLVHCFNDTLVQANEENLRLLREQLENIKDEFYGDISWGLEKAFPILWKYREARRGAVVCNQAIMLITEGLDYEYRDVLFKIYNHIPSEKHYRPIRLFTYLLGTEENDAQRMKWIACANMGYYVNVTVVEEVREKVLKYLEVMSRPINLSPEVEAEPAWTALYVHLSDRRLSNWLWKKNEGNRQRDRLIKYEKEQLKKLGKVFEPKQKHFTLETSHPYEEYLKVREYKYLTSVSLPVYDLRPNKTKLLGVAGVDVPLDYIKQLTEPHRIGVNGYAFIITNNGYVLHHPDHRCEFKDRILKPTFNRVDFTEVEISDETIEPRKFDKEIIELRENIVLQHKGHRELRVRTPIDDMKRVILSTRHYFYTKIGPFSLVIALPDRYGVLVIRHPKSDGLPIKNISKKLLKNKNWRVHPKWMYTCKTHRAHKSPEQELLHFLERKKTPANCDTDLVEALLKDMKLTEWFDTEETSAKKGSVLQDAVVLTFMATHAGLTRWKNLIKVEENEKHFANVHNKAPDEVYYRRSAEINYDHPDVYIYSVPLDMETYDENTTLITASNVVFHEKDEKRAPVSAIGFQILHQKVNNLINALKCNTKNCKLTCGDTWRCFVLDNDGYVILDNNTNNIGKSVSDIDPILTDYLVQDGVYKDITVYDYQGTCYPNYYPKDPKFYGPSAEDVKKKDIKCTTPIKCKTIEYLRRQLQKTTPTPCDIELKMYNSLWKDNSRLTPTKSRIDCNCPYVSQHIKGTNLMLIVVNGTCCPREQTIQAVNEFPKEITYNLTLPCYIATMNNFTKRHYMKCITKTEKEFIANVGLLNCGGEGITPME